MNNKHLFFALLAGLILTAHGWFGGNGGDSGSDGGDSNSNGVGNGGNGGDGGDANGPGGNAGDGGNGGDGGWFGRKRTTKLREHPYSTFQTFDDNKDGLITLEEFLGVRGAGGEKLFNRADADNNNLLTCLEFSRAVLRFGGKPIC